MKYLKLFLPIPVALLLIFLSERYINDASYTGVYFFKTVLFTYYFRLGNAGTPLINTLTVILIFMGLGEYLISIQTMLGQIIFIIADVAFGILYFFRQKMKDRKDKVSNLKIASVSVFVLTNLATLNQPSGLTLVALGTLFIASVYFSDRMFRISDSKRAIKGV